MEQLEGKTALEFRLLEKTNEYRPAEVIRQAQINKLKQNVF